MSYNSQKLQNYTAHVQLESGTVLEVNVEAGDRWSASNKVYNKLGLTGPNDAKIKSFLMVETEAPKPAKERRDRSKDKRYRVTVYLSPSSGSPIVYNLGTTDPKTALLSVLHMYHIPDADRAGPYHVQEVMKDNVLLTRLVKHAHTFTDVTIEDVVPDKPVVSDDEEEMFNRDEWDDAWEYALHGMPRPSTPVWRPSEAEVIAKLSEVFKTEKRAALPKVKVTRK